MRRIVASLGFDGQRRLYGDGRAAGFFGTGMLLLGTCLVVNAILFGDLVTWPAGGFFVLLIVFGAAAVHAFSDLAVGRATPVLVGATRAAALLAMLGVATFYVTSYAVAGDTRALAVLALGPAVVAFIFLARWGIRKV